MFAAIQTRKLYHLRLAFKKAPVKETQAVHQPRMSSEDAVAKVSIMLFNIISPYSM